MKSTLLALVILMLSVAPVRALAEEAAAGAGAADDAPETETLIWPDGTRYVGGVKDGKRSGKGTIFWEDGTRFVGNFKNDMREGPGTMILPDGTVYNGYFSEDKLVQAPAEPAEPVANTERQVATNEPASRDAETQQPAVASARAGESTTLQETPPPQTDMPGEIGSREVTELTDDLKEELMSMVDLWAAAWSEQNVPQYLAYYSEDFEVPGQQSRSAWEALRRSRLTRPGFIELEITFERFEIVEPNVVEVTFEQVYESDVYSDETMKTLTLTKEGPFWRILDEVTN